MKRLLLAVSVVVLALTASDAGASEATNAAAKLGRSSVKAIAAARKHEAGREAEQLLLRFVLPPAAKRLRNPPDLPLLRYSGLGTPEYAELVGRHGIWRVDAPFGAVLRFVKAHRLPGFERGVTSAEHPGRPPANLVLGYTARIGGSRFPSRMLTVTVVRHSGRTLIRVDAGAVWIYPRSPRETIPTGVREIDIRFGRLDVARVRRVTMPRTVARIIRWLNALDIVQPGVFVRCGPVNPSPTMTFDFRARRGVLLARAKAPQRGYSTLCNPVSFTIHGRPQTPLMGADFTMRVERLLRIR